DALPRRDPQRAVGVLVSKPVERQILLGRQPSAGDADADHELGALLLAGLLELGRAVTVVALVDAVELEEVVAVLVERRAGRVGEPGGQRATQRAALPLHLFDLGVPSDRHPTLAQEKTALS